VGEAIHEDAPRSRRAILAAAAGSAAALAVSAIKPVGIQAVAAPMLTETDNAATATTGVTNSTGGSKAFFGHAATDGVGAEGTSVIGPGLYGISSDSSDPEGNPNNAGVVGVAGDTVNVAANIALTGVYGTSDPSPVDGFVGAGVWGDSADFGVIGTGATGVLGDGVWGVMGATASAAGIGIYATADAPTGRALRVEGRAEFTRSGRTLVKAGNAKKTISLAGCTSSSLVFAVLASNRTGRWVRAVVPTTGSFTIYFNTTLANDTNVTWIAFTNPANHGG
jgi:hypothetical protein